MAKLLKLDIQGIRSFGPEDEDAQTVNFSTPVTLILGENGCGKTTIIECLKFACTGELPIGTKAGQGFVNDPKLNSCTTTKGRIRLKILDSQANEVVIFKAVKVEQTSYTAQKFSTLDSSLTLKKPSGEKHPISGRCIDIETQACTYMGVSKSILNNVVFCHQENSLWPLDEGKKLKEKFDEIFDATRYNVCINSIRKRIKSETNNLKILKEGLIYKKDLKGRVERERIKLQEKEEKLNTFIVEINDSKKDMEPLGNRIEEICELENNFVTHQRKCASKESEKKNIEEQVKSIREKLDKEFEGSDLDLSEEIAMFEENHNKHTKQIEELKVKKLQIEKDEQNRNVTIQKCQVQLGQLQAIKKQQDETVTERNSLIQSWNPEEYSKTDMDNSEEVKNLIESLHLCVSKSKTSLNSLYDDFQEEEKKLQSNIDECLQSTITLEQKIQSNQNQIAEVRKKNRDTNTQLKRLDISDEELKRYDSKIAIIERNLQNLSQTFDAETISNEIETSKLEIRRLEETLEDLESVYKLLQKNYVLENDIETRTDDLLKRENGIEEFKNNHYEDFRQLFREVPSKNFKMLTTKIQQVNKERVANLSRTIEIKTKEVTKLESKIQFEKEKLQSLRDELEKSERKTLTVCDNRPYNTVYNEVEQSIEKLQKSRGQLSSAKIMYEKFVRDFKKEKPCCPVCESDFNNNKTAVNKIISKIESQIHDIPGELKKVEDELKKKQDLFNQIQQIKPVHVRIEEIKNMLIPSLNEDIGLSSEKYNQEEKALMTLNEEIIEPQRKVEICSRLIEEATLIDQYIIESEKFRQQIDDLKVQLVKVASDASREEVESDINMKKITVTALRQKCDTDQKKLDQNKMKLQELREEKNRIIEKRLQLHKTMQGKPQLQDQIKELSEKEKDLENEIIKLKQELQPEEEKLLTAKRNLNATKVKNKDTIDSERSKNNQLQKNIDAIQKLQITIESFHKKDIHGQFNTILQKFNENKSEMENLQKQKEKVSEKIADFQRQQASREFERRKLDDNLELRKKNKQVIQLTNEINKLNMRLGSFDYKSLQTEKNQLRSRYVALQGTIDKKEGQRNELKLSITDMKIELNKPENKDAYKNYIHKLYECQITTQSINDLKLFVDGLENAIIDFHKGKMTNINKAIRELWRSIYRGNDIDYIQINTEESSRTAARRVYNYKVVQMKNNVELEMRGRCSAGQKVLACLIIRMALAETFSHNCGILALDEPTTNLDRENIISLSDALAHMINVRRVEKSFQLIVITHDEEFVKALSNIERIHACHRVKRNNKGRTIIVEEAI